MGMSSEHCGFIQPVYFGSNAPLSLPKAVKWVSRAGGMEESPQTFLNNASLSSSIASSPLTLAYYPLNHFLRELKHPPSSKETEQEILAL